MDEMLTTIAYQSQELQERDEYIGVLEFAGACLGFVALLFLVTIIYLLYR